MIWNDDLNWEKNVRGPFNEKQKLSDKTSTKKNNTRIHKTFKKSSCGRTPETKKDKKKNCIKKKKNFNQRRYFN